MDYIEGTIKTITFYNDDNAFAILKVMVDEASTAPTLFDVKDEVHTLKGYLPDPKKGEAYRFYGQFEHHPKYGEQFNFKQVEVLKTATAEGVKDYLASDLFSGVGEKTAERIVDTLGVDAIDQITKNPDVLDRVQGISKKHKKTLSEGLEMHKSSEQTLIKLYEYEVSPRLAKKLIDTFAQDTLKVLEDNPYHLIESVEGIGFERADIIAKKLGFGDDDPKRLRAMILYLFNYVVYAKGHTHIKREHFFDLCQEQFNKSKHLIDASTLETMFQQMLDDEKLLIENGYVTTPIMARQEMTIAKSLKTKAAKASMTDQAQVLKTIQSFESKEGIVYTAKQRQAIRDVFKHALLIITGGPGTGKTTIIKGLLHVYKNLQKAEGGVKSGDIHLIAPTGRAAKRMEETTNHPAKTIHRFLGYGYDGQFEHGPNNLATGTLFIIDETSMLDTALAAQLFSAIPEEGKIVLVGDDAQLPSVGPGQVLKDLIDSNVVPTIHLEDVHRQAEQSNIIHLARHIRKGTLPEDLTSPYPDRVIMRLSETRFHSRLKDMIDYYMNQGYSLFDDIQVLIPMYKGSVGIDATNRFLQETYNQQTRKSIDYGDKTFKVHDKVLQLQNRIEDGVMNGDQGRVVSIDSSDMVVVDFDGKEVVYKKSELDQLNLAYAMSVHKSQGSEYKVVIVPIFKRFAIMLKRKLIYTAITRSEDVLVIAGDIDWLDYAVKRTEDTRVSGLKDKLTGKKSRADIIEGKLKNLETPPKSHDASRVRIDDPLSAFDTLGEPLGTYSPYDFMDDNKNAS